MKRLFTLLFLLLFSLFGSAQNFTGQWKGGFMDNSSSFIGFGGERIEYVLEIETSGINVTGYSYTYFVDGGKRYYTICMLEGKINRKSKEIVVTEVERTKYNTPKDFRNCFQTHRLTYFKDGEDTESLEGTWIPAPNQEGDCGYGKTYLTRRMLKKTVPFQNNKPLTKSQAKDNPYKDQAQKKPPVTANTTVPKTTVTKPDQKNTTKTTKQTPPVVKDKPEIKKTTPATKDVAKNEKPVEKPKLGNLNDQVIKESNSKQQPDIKPDQKINTPSVKLEKRTNKVLKTIEVEQETISVELYDNGEIDGDTVSVFFNNKLVLSNKRLSDKPLTLKLEIDPDREDNELTMYAENLGEIPPNTALMVVKDGDKRYEVRITSDEQKNGTIAFVHKQ